MTAHEAVEPVPSAGPVAFAHLQLRDDLLRELGELLSIQCKALLSQYPGITGQLALHLDGERDGASNDSGRIPFSLASGSERASEYGGARS